MIFKILICAVILVQLNLAHGKSIKKRSCVNISFGELIRKIDDAHPSRVYECLAVNEYVFASAGSHSIKFWSTEPFPDSAEPLATISISATIKHLVVVGHEIVGSPQLKESNSFVINFWSTETYEKTRTFGLKYGHSRKLRNLKVSRDSKRLASVGKNKVLIWDLKGTDDQKPFEIDLEDSLNPEAVTFLEDGSIVIGDNKGNLHFYDKNCQFVGRKSDAAMKGGVTVLGTLYDGKVYTAGNLDKRIKIWSFHDLTALEEIIPTLILGKSNGAVHEVAELEYGKYIVSVAHENIPRIWSLESGEMVEGQHMHTKPIRCVGALHNNLFVTGSDDKSIGLWQGNNYE